MSEWGSEFFPTWASRWEQPSCYLASSLVRAWTEDSANLFPDFWLTAVPRFTKWDNKYVFVTTKSMVILSYSIRKWIQCLLSSIYFLSCCGSSCICSMSTWITHLLSNPIPVPYSVSTQCSLQYTLLFEVLASTLPFFHLISTCLYIYQNSPVPTFFV